MSVLDKVNEIIIQSLCSDMSEYIADQFGLDSIEVAEVVRKYLGQNPTPVLPSAVKKPNKKSRPTKKSSSGSKTCAFKITRGVHRGEMCQTVIRGNSNYCSKHKNRKSSLKSVDE